MAKPGELTEKQRRFVAAYCGPANGNATHAARLAGYRGTERVLQSIGSENLSKPIIDQAVRMWRDKLIEYEVASSGEVLSFATKVLRGTEEEVTVTVNKHGEFVENTAPPRIKDRLGAAKFIADVLRYGEPEPPASATMTPELEEALADWMLVRDEPIVRELLERKRANE